MKKRKMKNGPNEVMPAVVIADMLVDRLNHCEVRFTVTYEVANVGSGFLGKSFAKTLRHRTPAGNNNASK